MPLSIPMQVQSLNMQLTHTTHPPPVDTDPNKTTKDKNMRKAGEGGEEGAKKRKLQRGMLR